MKLFFTTLLILLFSVLSYGQENDDSPFVEDDDKTSVFTFRTNYPIPKRSAFYSALVPGLGQVYNRQYWKLGVVVAGLGAAGYFIHTNNKKYQQFRDAYILRIDNNPNTMDTAIATRNYTTSDLNTLQNQYRQWLEYSVVFTTVGYALNVLDAYVAANLRTFDVSDEIGLQMKPTFQNRQLGLALVLNFK